MPLTLFEFHDDPREIYLCLRKSQLCPRNPIGLCGNPSLLLQTHLLVNSLGVHSALRCRLLGVTLKTIPHGWQRRLESY